MSSIAPPTEVNGFPVTASMPLPDQEGSLPGHLVVCNRGTARDPWVTWVAFRDPGATTPSGEPQPWQATWGHYFATEAEANADLMARFNVS